jgi:TolB protein
MNADGTDPVQLTDDPAADRAPAWSPNGNRIAFTHFRTGNSGISDIWVMRADGSDKHRLTSDPSGGAYSDWQPLAADQD